MKDQFTTFMALIISLSFFVPFLALMAGISTRVFIWAAF